MERNSSAATFFPKNLAKTERKRAEALDMALNSEQIASLLSMRFNREPLYKSIEDFYTPEYLAALQSNAAPAELSKIEHYRKPTQKEVNLMHSDIHAKDDVYSYSGGQSEE
jgi:hypothetical protein